MPTMRDSDYYISPFAPRPSKDGPTGPNKDGKGFGYLPDGTQTAPMPVFNYDGQMAPMPVYPNADGMNAPGMQEAMASQMLAALGFGNGPNSPLANLLMGRRT